MGSRISEPEAHRASFPTAESMQNWVPTGPPPWMPKGAVMAHVIWGKKCPGPWANIFLLSTICMTMPCDEAMKCE